MAAGNTRAIIAAFLANLAIALAKLGGFAVTGASSMLAEAVHSFADTGNQGLLLWGGKAARREPDDKHQFGYARERYFWSFIVALVLFTLGSLFAIWEGTNKLRDPHEIESAGVAIAILLLGLVLESWSFRTAMVAARPHKGTNSWVTYIRRSRSPELPVVLLEDLGATIGLGLALAAITASQITGNPIWDAVGTLSIGVLLGLIASVLAYEMRSLLLGEGATPEDMAAIRDAVETTPGVERLIHLRTQHIGPDELLVAVKVVFGADLSVDQLTAAIDDIERRVRHRVPYAHPMYVEPGRRQAPDTTIGGAPVT